MVQFAPTARLVPQPLANTNEDAFTPVTAMLPIDSDAVPELVITTVWEALEAPTAVEANVRLVADKVTGGGSPVPFNAILCGEVLALSVMVTPAVNAPVLVGAKCPWMLQFAPAARVVPQLFANTNEDAFVPATAMLVIDKAAFPLFVTVTDCELLDAPIEVAANEMLVADRDTTGPTPVPVNATLWGELPALSVIVIAAVSGPAVVGAKCPWIEQLVPAARLVPQLLPNTNEEALAPVTEMLEMDSVTVPEFTRIRVCEALIVPTWTEPKASEDAESVTGASTWMEPVPLIVEFTVSVAVIERVPGVLREKLKLPTPPVNDPFPVIFTNVGSLLVSFTVPV